MDITAIIIKIKAAIVKLAPEGLLKFIPGNFVVKERTVKDIVEGFTKAIDELNELAISKAVEQNALTEEIAALSVEVVVAAEQESQALKISSNISKIVKV